MIFNHNFKIGDRVAILCFAKRTVGTVVDYYYDAYENGNVWVVHVSGQGLMEFDDCQITREGSG